MVKQASSLVSPLDFHIPTISHNHERYRIASIECQYWDSASELLFIA